MDTCTQAPSFGLPKVLGPYSQGPTFCRCPCLAPGRWYAPTPGATRAGLSNASPRAFSGRRAHKPHKPSNHSQKASNEQHNNNSPQAGMRGMRRNLARHHTPSHTAHTATSCGEAACSEAVQSRTQCLSTPTTTPCNNSQPASPNLGHRAGQRIAGRLVRLAQARTGNPHASPIPVRLDDGGSSSPTTGNAGGYAETN